VSVNAVDFLLPSTKDAKYAHAPFWITHGWAVAAPMQPACWQELPNLNTDFPTTNTTMRSAGKPPCPKCIEEIRRHVEFLAEFADSYEHLTWEEAS